MFKIKITKHIYSNVLFALLTVLNFSCTNAGNSQLNLVEGKSATEDTSKNILIKNSELSQYIKIQFSPDSTISYSQIKNEVRQIKDKINIDSISEDSLSRLFTEIIVNKIIPYWYGTTWGFYGYTSVPNNGEIACGYFLSTILQDAGLNIDRYKLAQQYPYNEALSLATDSAVIEIVVENQNPYDYIDIIQDTLKQGLYFIGYDNGHVGFILNNGNQLYLIHSNYYERKVLIERIQNSVVFPNYYRFYFVELSTNKKLMNKWILNERVEVVRSQ